MRNSETSCWLDFALAFKYITQKKFVNLAAQNEEIGRLLGHMLQKSEK
jgi:23S rRNA-intervening sequence protein